MGEHEGVLGWLFAAVATVVPTLVATVAFFYKQQIKDYVEFIDKLRQDVARLSTRVDECEIDRNELRIRNAVLEARVGRIEDGQAGNGAGSG